MQVTFWGVRGSIPTPGEFTRRYGGNSSCLEVRHPGLPPLVLDCGTGARALGARLVAERGRELHLLFTHLHLDHVFGLPFFAPIYTPGYRNQIYVPAASVEHARERIGGYMGGVLHPSRLSDVDSQVEVHSVRAGRPFEPGGWRVTPVALNHPGGSLAYRVEAGSQCFVYVTDTSPFSRPDEGLSMGEPATRAELRMASVLRGADLVVYDTMYTREEYLEKMTWGHSYPEYAVALCREAAVRNLILFHHLPDATDEDLDALASHWSAARDPRVTVAVEGRTVDVGEVDDVR